MFTASQRKTAIGANGFYDVGLAAKTRGGALVQQLGGRTQVIGGSSVPETMSKNNRWRVGSHSVTNRSNCMAGFADGMPGIGFGF
jgi:hypothetical protein